MTPELLERFANKGMEAQKAVNDTIREQLAPICREMGVDPQKVNALNLLRALAKYQEKAQLQQQVDQMQAQINQLRGRMRAIPGEVERILQDESAQMPLPFAQLAPPPPASRISDDGSGAPTEAHEDPRVPTDVRPPDHYPRDGDPSGDGSDFGATPAPDRDPARKPVMQAACEQLASGDVDAWRSVPIEQLAIKPRLVQILKRQFNVATADDLSALVDCHKPKVAPHLKESELDELQDELNRFVVHHGSGTYQKRDVQSAEDPNDDNATGEDDPIFEAGKVYSTKDAGVQWFDLDAAVPTEFRGHDEDTAGRIHRPLHTPDGLYAVISATHGTGYVRYALVPAYSESEWDAEPLNKRPQTWRERRREYKDCAPEDVPTEGLLVRDDMHTWVLGSNKGQQIYIEINADDHPEDWKAHKHLLRAQARERLQLRAEDVDEADETTRLAELLERRREAEGDLPGKRVQTWGQWFATCKGTGAPAEIEQLPHTDPARAWWERQYVSGWSPADAVRDFKNKNGGDPSPAARVVHELHAGKSDVEQVPDGWTNHPTLGPIPPKPKDQTQSWLQWQPNAQRALDKKHQGQMVEPKGYWLEAFNAGRKPSQAVAEFEPDSDAPGKPAGDDVDARIPPELRGDPNLNAHGVYVHGVRAIVVYKQGRDSIIIRVAQGKDGRYRTGDAVTIGTSGMSGGPSAHSTPYDSEAYAIRTHAHVIANWLKRNAERDAAQRGQFARAAHAVEVFIAGNPSCQVPGQKQKPAKDLDDADAHAPIKLGQATKARAAAMDKTRKALGMFGRGPKARKK